MITFEQVGTVGGVWSLLMLWHFVADWIPQTHAHAIAKTKDSWIRFEHCMLYTVLFGPAYFFCATGSPRGIMIMVWLFVSHFIIDSYVITAWWAKHVRRDPAFDETELAATTITGVELRRPRTYEEGMKAMMSTPVGAILCITMDQILHLVCLVPVAILLVWH